MEGKRSRLTSKVTMGKSVFLRFGKFVIVWPISLRAVGTKKTRAGSEIDVGKGRDGGRWCLTTLPANGWNLRGHSLLRLTLIASFGSRLIGHWQRFGTQLAVLGISCVFTYPEGTRTRNREFTSRSRYRFRPIFLARRSPIMHRATTSTYSQPVKTARSRFVTIRTPLGTPPSLFT